MIHVYIFHTCTWHVTCMIHVEMKLEINVISYRLGASDVGYNFKCATRCTHKCGG